VKKDEGMKRLLKGKGEEKEERRTEKKKPS
jgi:hypothetical protein